MKQVTMISLAASPTGNYEPGKTYELSDEMADDFVAAGAARPFTPPTPAPVDYLGEITKLMQRASARGELADLGMALRAAANAASPDPTPLPIGEEPVLTPPTRPRRGR